MSRIDAIGLVPAYGAYAATPLDDSRVSDRRARVACLVIELILILMGVMK